MFDILAMQDGVGCNRDITPEDIPVYLAALSNQCFYRITLNFG